MIKFQRFALNQTRNVIIIKRRLITSQAKSNLNVFPDNIKAVLNFRNGNRVSTLQPGEIVKVLEPATGKLLCSFASSGGKDVDETVKSAKTGYKEWSCVSGAERGRVLSKAAQIIKSCIEDLALVEVQDSGKPIWEARLDVASCVDCFEYFGGLAASIYGQHIPLSNGNFAITRKEPLGVCAAIGAWNYPFQIACWKTAPALACGNSVIYKPSSFTPLTAVMLGDILKASALPDGCFNIVQGGKQTGHLLTTHPDVAKVSFTGSVSTGQQIMKDCAHTVKNVTLELGGKSPLIIFDDCDLDNAVKGAIMANFLSQGQVCSNATRVYVQKSILHDFLQQLVQKTKVMKIGNPMDPDTRVGASITQEHAENVLASIQTAVKEGATVAYGGERVFLPDPKFKDGYYLSPCILSNCHDDMTVVKEEIFGAVLSILTFDTEDEVIVRANNSPLGLAGGIFTRDFQKAHNVANKLEAGIVWINNYNFNPPEIPFGGYKMSGIGRENGTAVLDYYTQIKTVYVELGNIECPF